MKCNPVLASKTQADRPIGAAQPVEFPHIPGGIEDGEGTQQPFFTPGEQPKSVSTNAVRLVVPQSSIDDKGEWTAIVPKSKGRSIGIDPDEHKKEQLDPELTRVLAEVERSLTDVDRARILQREEAENKALDSDTLSSRGEGPSNLKGKGPDPTDWGQLDLSESEMDPGAQRAALKQWSDLKQLVTSDRTRSKNVPLSNDDSKVEDMTNNKLTKATKGAKPTRTKGEPSAKGNPIEKMIDHALRAKNSEERASVARVIEPAQQIAPTSYLGKALAGLGRTKARHKSSLSDSSSDEGSESSSSDSDSYSSPSDSSSSDSSPSSDESSDSSELDRQSKQRARKLKGKKKHSKKARKSKKSKKAGYGKIKPIMPLVYSGEPKVEAFHQFVTEGTAFVEAGGVRTRNQVFMLSHFLTEEARTFYVREVASNPWEWRLKDFFVELFNACFPINFWTEQREKLKQTYQNDCSVRDYLSDLNLLWNVVGDVSDREKVIKLWFGFNQHIQAELWKDKLNPEKSTLKQVVAAAEIIEIAHSVSNWRGWSNRDADTNARNRKGKRSRNHDTNVITTGRMDQHGKKDFRSKHDRTKDLFKDPGEDRKDHSKQFQKAKERGPRPGSKVTERTRLSKEEHDRRVAEKLCFNCGLPGHLSNTCTKDRTVRGGSSSGPPGLSSHRMGLGGVLRDLQSLADTTERVDTLTLGSVHLEIAPGSNEDDDDWLPGLPLVEDGTNLSELDTDDSDSNENDVPYNHRGRMGDPLARRAEHILHQGCPYPGDNTEDPDCKDRLRFSVHRTSVTHHVIYDAYRPIAQVSDALVESSLLLIPEFNLGDWYAKHLVRLGYGSEEQRRAVPRFAPMTKPVAARIQALLTESMDAHWRQFERLHRFDCIMRGEGVLIWDRATHLQTFLPFKLALKEYFDVVGWYRRACQRTSERVSCVWKDPDLPWTIPHWVYPEQPTHEASSVLDDDGSISSLELFGVQVPRGTYAALERNSATVKDFKRMVPKPIVVVVNINGHPARALLDSGSLADFMSTTLAEQLNVKLFELAKPLTVQLAVQGSRSKINFGTTVNFQYQGINCERQLDIANLQNYDLILGTPFLFQHQVMLGLNDTRVIVGSSTPLPIRGPQVQALEARSVDLLDQAISEARDRLYTLAKPLCAKASETDLPPLRAINHTIPLIDISKVYPWRPSRCLEAMHPQWVEKRRSYLKTGRWRVTSEGNTVPMLLIKKPGTDKLRTVVDLRERNKNTHKLSAPLPDIDGILRHVCKGRFRSIIDGQDAYEQIRIVPEHVERTAVTTPDGNMLSTVIQIGDCNAPATYQALMNHLFSNSIGKWMDVYLDDIVVYSEMLEEHIEHVKIVLDILQWEKLYLSEGKLRFLCKEMKILGRIIDDDGIRMDPEKVDRVLNWKVPTNRDLLRGFIGSAGYLADDIYRVHVPMGVLSAITGDSVPFRWTETEQRAFDQVKRYVQACAEHRHVPLSYGGDAAPVWFMTDACVNGVAGVIAQGSDWKTARVAAFYSAKMTSTQQNYPVHEQEMLAGIEGMLRYRDILQGTRFTWLTDHKGLIHLYQQKNLSGRQARWLEKISEFDFDIKYVPGPENILPDALSRMYSGDAPGTVRASSEYVTLADHGVESAMASLISMPVLVGTEAGEGQLTPRRSARPNKGVP